MNRTGNELTYSELKLKDVVDFNDGKNLGHICDMVFSCDLKHVVGIITPYGKRGVFNKGQEIFIPLSCIKNIGQDVIIVDIGSLNNGKCSPVCKKEHEENEHCEDKPQCNNPAPCPPPKCDNRCDKCMLFDCQFRWKGTAH